MALTKLLDLLAASGLTILAVRATIDQDNVSVVRSEEINENNNQLTYFIFVLI